jgi:hypothetical protein
MPAVGLSEFASVRLQAISFFIVVFLLAAWAINAIWNMVAVDVSWLPQLTYRKAMGLTTLWGLLFVIVLTMISGTRELMTPGAWTKQGATYKLSTSVDAKETPQPSRDVGLIDERNRKLILLYGELKNFAKLNNGRFPTKEQFAEWRTPAWEVPGSGGMNFAYWEGRMLSDPPLPLAGEPNLRETEPWIVFTDGSIRALPIDELVSPAAGSESP